MSDGELDDLLHCSVSGPSQAASATAVHLVREVRDEVAGAVPIRRRRRSGLRVVVGVVAAVVVLSGAGTTAAYQLSIPPFSTLEDGVERAQTGVPVTYTNSLGRQVDCLAFIEYRNLTDEQRAAIEAASKGDRWDGRYGQRVLDGLHIPDADVYKQNTAVSDAVGKDLWAAAKAAVPDMTFMKGVDGPVFNGYSFSCALTADSGGADGHL